MNTFVADPHWGWWIVWYFYLGGIAAGAYFMAALVEFVGDEEDRKLGRIGYFLAAPLVAACGLLLIADLDQPTRFWHMLLNAETMRPHMKYWSPMSVGAWALLVFGVISTLSFLGAMAEARACGLGKFATLATRLHRGVFGRIFDLFATASGFFIASYTGALLTATNQPVWSDNPWIAALFLASAATSGIAAIQIVSRLAHSEVTGAQAKLDRVDGWALWLELAIVVLFVASASPVSLRLIKSGVWLPLVLCTVGAGILVPLALRSRTKLLGTKTTVISAVLVLLGGFVLRYCVLATAPAMLERMSAEQNIERHWYLERRR